MINCPVSGKSNLLSLQIAGPLLNGCRTETGSDTPAQIQTISLFSLQEDAEQEGWTVINKDEQSDT